MKSLFHFEPNTRTFRASRGECWDSTQTHARQVTRDVSYPKYYDSDSGFRIYLEVR